MPRGDGTGPQGSGPGTGRGRGRGRMGGRWLGPGTSCVCPLCGAAIAHQRGVPCSLTTCPKCGARMTRR